MSRVDQQHCSSIWLPSVVCARTQYSPGSVNVAVVVALPVLVPGFWNIFTTSGSAITMDVGGLSFRVSFPGPRCLYHRTVTPARAPRAAAATPIAAGTSRAVVAASPSAAWVWFAAGVPVVAAPRAPRAPRAPATVAAAVAAGAVAGFACWLIVLPVSVE